MHDAPFVVTVHDVMPRMRALVPIYSVLAYPQLARRTSAVIVHTRFAAEMLLGKVGRPLPRLEVIPHPAPRPAAADRVAARRELGWPDDSLIAVVPGVIRPVKLIREVLAAVTDLPDWRIALAGRFVDRNAVSFALGQGALALESPDDADYERAIVASDCVLCLRSGTVGEANGPLLDALGAGRAVLATATGSIPEVAGDAAYFCDGATRSVRAALIDLANENARAELERAAAARAANLSWEASAAAHAEVFREVFGG
jgi:glycosyltransferase involved in cell wall biosynthesis